jgi:hypothetical protein
MGPTGPKKTAPGLCFYDERIKQAVARWGFDWRCLFGFTYGDWSTTCVGHTFLRGWRDSCRIRLEDCMTPPADWNPSPTTLQNMIFFKNDTQLSNAAIEAALEMLELEIAKLLALKRHYAKILQERNQG